MMVGKILFVLFMMMFCHIVDDYYLQGWLASAKQKSWWEKNAPDKLYKNDYIVGLLCHSISWAFMIMLPLAVVTQMYTLPNTAWLLLLYPANAAMHMWVDNQKANVKSINLIVDQTLHLLQIITTFAIYVVITIFSII